MKQPSSIYWPVSACSASPREGQAMQVIEKRVKVAVGLNEMARQLGCSRGHLSLVIHGHRKSKRLESRLNKMGINIRRAS